VSHHPISSIELTENKESPTEKVNSLNSMEKSLPPGSSCSLTWEPVLTHNSKLHGPEKHSLKELILMVKISPHGKLIPFLPPFLHKLLMVKLKVSPLI